MKKKILIAALSLLCCAGLPAQSPERFQELYRNQVGAVGYSGPGVVSVLDKWEASFPDDGEMLRARFSYCLAKSMHSEVVPKDRQFFMGEKPMFELKDSVGNSVPYFVEKMFDDSLFNEALTYIGRAMELYPREMSYRSERVSAYISYEKENPDRSLSLLLALADEYRRYGNDEWTNFGEKVTPETFGLLMQDFCYIYYHIATPSSYEAFFKLSTVMNRMYPDSELFLGDLGSYWLVAREDTGKARKYYGKLLKINPESELGNRNMAVIKQIEASRKPKR